MTNLKNASVSGFTLIEVLVAIAILAIAGAIAIPNYHHFNEFQKLQNTSNGLKAALLTAENDAQSGAKCHNDPSDYRSAYFDNYGGITIKCHDANDTTDTTLYSDSSSVTAPYSDITVSPPSGCGSPTYLIFNQSGITFSNNQYLDQNTCTFTGASENVTVKNSAINSSECITVSRGGSVEVANNGC